MTLTIAFVLYALSGLASMVLSLLRKKQLLLMQSQEARLDEEDILMAVLWAILGPSFMISVAWEQFTERFQPLKRIDEIAEKTLLYWERKGK